LGDASFRMKGGDKIVKKRFFNLLFDYHYPFTYSFTICNSKIKESPNSIQI